MAKCKVCGNELVKKKTKSGEVVLYCTDCKKIYKLKAKADEAEKKVKEEEEEEEEEEAPKKVVAKKLPEAPVKEEEDDEEEEEEAPKAAPIPVIAKEAPKAAPVAAAPSVDPAQLAAIAESLSGIDASLKGLLKIFSNIYKA